MRLPPDHLVLLEIAGQNLEMVKAVDCAYVGSMQVMEGLQVSFEGLLVLGRGDIELRSFERQLWRRRGRGDVKGCRQLDSDNRFPGVYSG